MQKTWFNTVLFASSFVALVAGAVVACGDSGAQGDAAPGPDPQSFALTWGPVSVPAGVERTQCVTKALGNLFAIRVGQVSNNLGGLSHHMIVYRVADDEPTNDEPINCQPFLDTLDPTRGAPLMVTQRFQDSLTLPDGVAFTLDPSQKVRIELHYINASEDTRELEATTRFDTIAEEDFVSEAEFIFVGNPDIELAPGVSTLGPTYFPLPSWFGDVEFFAITGHQHQWGRNVTVSTTTGSAGVDTPVYDLESFVWSEPETVVHDPPFRVPAGGGFRFTCEWNNMSGQQVYFGESANDEMCFFWAYYYPSRGALVCIHTDQFGGHDVCCPGDQLCNLLEL